MLADTNCLMIIPSISFGRAPSATGYRSSCLSMKSRILIFMDATTGLRQSELFGLRWRDLDFDGGQMNVVRSVVQGVISRCKTETSMKPIPLGPYLADMLKKWKDEAVYVTPDDWVFSSVPTQGKLPV